MNNAHHKLMCYSGIVKKDIPIKFSKQYYVCVPSNETLETLYLRKDGSIGDTTKAHALKSINGYWDTYKEAHVALLVFQKNYRLKKNKDRKRINKTIKHKSHSPLIRAGLFKPK